MLRTSSMPGGIKKVSAEEFQSHNHGKPVWATIGMPGNGGTVLFRTTTPKHYRIASVEGKGLAMYATKALHFGERVGSEYPMGMVNNLKGMIERDPAGAEKWLKTTIRGLSKKQRDVIEDLHDAFKLRGLRYTGLVQANAFGVPHLEFAFFEDWSRINHSCQHNCEWIWDQERMQMHIVAVKDITLGDEITIHYGKAEGTRLQRQWNLERRYRFKCTCSTCSLTGPKLEASDARRVEIERLTSVLEKNKTVSGLHPVPDLGPIRSLIRLYTEEGLQGTCIGELYFQAAGIALYHSDVARGPVSLKRANDIHNSIHPEKLDTKATDMEGFGTSRAWAGERPTESTGQAFEEWLWSPPAVSWCPRPPLGPEEDKSEIGQINQIERQLANLIHHCKLNKVDPRSFMGGEGDSAEEDARKAKAFKEIVAKACG